MASPAQIVANRQNAQNSTGPKTQEGKTAVSANARKHGLAAAFTVLAHEDQAEFDRARAALREQHQPGDLHQEFLVNQMIKAQWQLARAERLETIALELLIQPQPDSNDADIRIVNAILAAGRDAFALFARYAVQAERSYYKAYREFAAAKRIQNEADLVAHLDRSLMHSVMTAPLPGSPSYGSPYGHNEKSPLPNKPNPAAATAPKPATAMTPGATIPPLHLPREPGVMPLIPRPTTGARSPAVPDSLEAEP